MSDPNPRRVLLAAALDHLEWLDDPPHTLDDCLRVQANEAEAVRDDSRGMVSGGRSHADPTAGSLNRPPVPEGDPEAASIDIVVSRMSRAADELADAICDGMSRRRRRPSHVEGRQGRIIRTIGALRDAGDGFEEVHDGSHGDWAVYLVILLRSVHDDAAWLRSKGEGIYDAARLESRVQAKQKPLKGCQSCARDTDTPNGDPYFEPTDAGRYARYCRWCGDYLLAEKAEPPLRAVQWMHKHGKKPTTKVLAEAGRK